MDVAIRPRPTASVVVGGVESSRSSSFADRTKTMIKRAAERLRGKVRLSEKPQKPWNNQTSSLLFRLPPELRDPIWRYVLEGERKCHFHVYDEIYTSCTYERKKPDPAAQSSTQQTSLLLTCRAIYEEASHFLWEDARFELVILAGLARPRRNLKGLNNLGLISDCAPVLRRMRHAQIVVQPGQQPDMDAFRGRLNDFLAALDHGRHLKTLGLAFNFHEAMSNRMLATHIIGSFVGLGMARAPGTTPPTVQLLGRPVDITFAMSVTRQITTLMHVLRGDDTGEVFGGGRVVYLKECSARGFLGEIAMRRTQHPPPTRREDAELLALGALMLLVGLAILPVSVPLVSYFVRDRKNQKGEK